MVNAEMREAFGKLQDHIQDLQEKLESANKRITSVDVENLQLIDRLHELTSQVCSRYGYPVIFWLSVFRNFVDVVLLYRRFLVFSSFLSLSFLSFFCSVLFLFCSSFFFFFPYRS